MLQLCKPMTSLVLLQRMRPDSVYIACGDSDDLVDKLCQDMPADSCVEVAAEFPHMGHASAQAKNALKGASCQDGWIDIPTGVALQQLGVCFGSTKPNDLTKKPILTKLNKEDRVLIQAALKEAKAIRKAEICEEDRVLIQAALTEAKAIRSAEQLDRNTLYNTWRLVETLVDMCRSTQVAVKTLTSIVGAVHQSLSLIHI